MTLNELRYILAVARERHFGRAAEYCHVSQPSLSVAVKKLEDELQVKIFERRSNDVTLTPTGAAIVEEAEQILALCDKLRECAAQGRDPLTGSLRLGVIYTIAPYLVPQLVGSVHSIVPMMPLILSENYTSALLDQLKNGQIDCAIMALPISQPGLMMQPLYDEDFVAAVPADHPISRNESIVREQLKEEPMLLLGSGHCFRDQILDFCSDIARSDGFSKRAVEGTSLQTIVYMVSQGLGLTVLPASAVPYYESNPMIKILEFGKPNVPRRRVVLVWRKSFPRLAAIEAVTKAVSALKLHGTRILTSLPAVAA